MPPFDPRRPATRRRAVYRWGTPVLALVGIIVLAACGSSTGAGSAATGTASSSSGVSAGSDPSVGAISVAASTDVWGDIASAIGGDLVHVDAFISDPAQDPHSFEANPRAQLILSRAALVIENGGGYDDFMDTMLAASGSEAPVINAVTVSGKATAGGDVNEHVWYDFPTVVAVATQVASKLSTIEPSAASTFNGNLTTFRQRVAGLTAGVEAIAAAHAGAAVAVTEPVPLYLLQAAGLVNQTPPEFSEAIEEGSDVPARVLAATLALFTDKKVALLAYNEQTTGPQTDQVVAAARDNGIPTVPVTETLPQGDDYISWMQANVVAVAKALGR